MRIAHQGAWWSYLLRTNATAVDRAGRRLPTQRPPLCRFEKAAEMRETGCGGALLAPRQAADAAPTDVVERSLGALSCTIGGGGGVRAVRVGRDLRGR